MDSQKVLRAVASFFVPGLGQLMNGTIGRGLKFLIGFIVLWLFLLFINVGIIHNLIGLIVRLIAAYDAYAYNKF